MALPLLTTGLKLFQATRSKGSPQSTTKTTEVSEGYKVTGAGAMVGPAPGQRRSSTPPISISKLLPQSSAPQKDVKFKDRRYKPLGDVVNSITKSFASILSTFKAEDKLSRQQADDQRIQNAEDAKIARESKLEGQNKFSPLKTISNKTSQSGSWLDSIIKFIASIALGSLVLALYKNFTSIIQFFKNSYEIIVDFFKRLGQYVSPLWDLFKWIVRVSSPLTKLTGDEDSKYAKIIPQEVDDISKGTEKLEQESEKLGESTSDGEFNEESDVELVESKAEFEDNKNTINNLQSFIGNFLPGRAVVAGTLEGKPIREDRSFARAMIKEHEGLRLDVYPDKEGNLTVGYGHKIDAGSPEDIRNLGEGDLITMERADQLFEQDFSEHLFAAQQLPGFFEASKRQQAALIDLTFNMGPNFLNTFPMMRKALEEGNFEEAARQLEFADPDNRPGVKSDYANTVGRRSDPIIKLLKDMGVDEFNHLKNIENLLSQQTHVNSKLADSIALLSQDEEEFDDSPIIIPIPKQQVASKVSGSGGGFQFIPIEGESGLNSKITRAKLAAV